MFGGLRRFLRGNEGAASDNLPVPCKPLGSEKPGGAHGVVARIGDDQEPRTNQLSLTQLRDLSLPDLMELVRQYNRLLAHLDRSVELDLQSGRNDVQVLGAHGGGERGRVRDTDWAAIRGDLKGFASAPEEHSKTLQGVIAGGMAEVRNLLKQRDAFKSRGLSFEPWVAWQRKTILHNSLDATTLFLADKVTGLANAQGWSKTHTLEVLKVAWVKETQEFLVRAFTEEWPSEIESQDCPSIQTEYEVTDEGRRKVGVAILFPDKLVGARWHWYVVEAIDEFKEESSHSLVRIGEKQEKAPFVLKYQLRSNDLITGKPTVTEAPMEERDAMNVFFRSQFLYMRVVVKDENLCYNPLPFSDGWRAPRAIGPG